MSILHAFDRNSIQRLQADQFETFALHGKQKAPADRDIRLAEAYQRAIGELEAASKNDKSLQGALAHVVELQNENVPLGVQKGVEVIRLQKQLQSYLLSQSQRKKICDEIVKIFDSDLSYEDSFQLRETIDCSYQGASPLHALVYDDLDTESCHKVLQIINKNIAKTPPEKITYSYMVYSDIDDTIKGKLNDKNAKVPGFYPASLEFYKQLGAVELAEGVGKRSEEKKEKVTLTFLSARPTVLQRFWNNSFKEELPDTKFYALYGSFPAILSAGIYYTVVTWLSAIADLLPEGGLKQHIKSFCVSEEAKTFITFALEKRLNIDRDLLLRPEVRPIFVGDCGEGDLLFLLAKNCGVPLPIEDPKIPDEYRGDKKWDGSLDAPGNPSNKPLYLGFAHALSSVTDYGVRPDPKFRREFETELGAYVFDNFVDNALYCLKKNILTRESCDKIVAEAKRWAADIDYDASHETKHIEKLTPDKQYRVKLLRSIREYEAATKK